MPFFFYRLLLIRSDAGKDWRQEEKGTTEDEMVGWHHRLDGHEFEQAPGIGDGLRSLVCCSPWGHKVLDMIEWLKWTKLNWIRSEGRVGNPFPWIHFHCILSLLNGVLGAFSWAWSKLVFLELEVGRTLVNSVYLEYLSLPITTLRW